MDLDSLRKLKAKSLNFKNIKPIREKISALEPKKADIVFGNTIKINLDLDIDSSNMKTIKDIAYSLKPWRKGAFSIDKLFIDSEWRSFVKYDILEPYLNIRDKIVGDIGCNNGYYMFRMVDKNPKKIVGFDPSVLFKTQFDFINFYVKTDIEYELFGIEHLEIFKNNFDVLLCLGVLYHRRDPIKSLDLLNNSLRDRGVLFLDTIIIDGEDEIALCPQKRYSKMKNVYFIPTLKTLKNWLLKAKFIDVEILAVKTTTTQEQRKTEWIDGQSLGSFLNPKDKSLTIEGYPAPKRAYIRCVKR